MKKVVYANSNAEFLNQTYGTNYKAFMRGRYPLNRETWVWMIRLDYTNRWGWKNRIINENEIWEEYVGAETPTYTNEAERRYRIVVYIKDNPNGREYHILGKYAFDAARSKVGRNVLIKVSD
jgi:hypothetical protein